VAIARKDNDSRSALGDQHPYEPSNIGIGHGAIDPPREQQEMEEHEHDDANGTATAEREKRLRESL
jgi:hypothetical protein